VSTPATSHDLDDSHRRADAAVFRLKQAEGKLRAARRAFEEHEQEPAVLTLRTLERIEVLLTARLPE
jgi:hypothetical protein